MENAILWRLSLREVWRYSELKRDLGHISHMMLSRQLKELEQDHLIVQTQYPVVPPKVEYGLTTQGHLALPAIHALCDIDLALGGKQAHEECINLKDKR